MLNDKLQLLKKDLFDIEDRLFTIWTEEVGAMSVEQSDLMMEIRDDIGEIESKLERLVVGATKFYGAKV